ncbi:hypothetical protein L227DRAFT_568808, partial [Lentinus tigrinus ALCF2SS1-6]
SPGRLHEHFTWSPDALQIFQARLLTFAALLPTTASPPSPRPATLCTIPVSTDTHTPTTHLRCSPGSPVSTAPGRRVNGCGSELRAHSSTGRPGATHRQRPHAFYRSPTPDVSTRTRSLSKPVRSGDEQDTQLESESDRTTRPCPGLQDVVRDLRPSTKHERVRRGAESWAVSVRKRRKREWTRARSGLRSEGGLIRELQDTVRTLCAPVHSGSLTCRSSAPGMTFLKTGSAAKCTHSGGKRVSPNAARVMVGRRAACMSNAKQGAMYETFIAQVVIP